jgi:PDZ domain-containing protein
MTAAGASHSRSIALRLSIAALAVLAIGALIVAGSARAGDDVPLTAGDAERDGTLDNATGVVTLPGASASPAAPALAAEPPLAESSPSASAATPAAAPSPADSHAYAATGPAAAPSSDATPERPEITNPTVPPLSNNGQILVGPPGTQEIPQALPAQTPGESLPAGVPASANDDLTRYQNEQDPELSTPNVGTLQDFVAEGDETSPIGVELRETTRKLSSGEEAEGLLVIKVERDSAAAKAGLRPYRRVAHNMLTGAAIGAAMVFPPAILILPIIDYTQVGESYDMIIGVDGSRVTNFIDFEERMRNIQPGELVYLSVVRNGKRIQIQVPVQPVASSATN